MKQLAFLLLICIAAPAWGQDKAAVKEAAKQRQVEKQAAVGAPRIPNPRRWKEDARHCLERPTNTEVIKCAEEYL
jgi:hypothetical protein